PSGCPCAVHRRPPPPIGRRSARNQPHTAPAAPAGEISAPGNGGPASSTRGAALRRSSSGGGAWRTGVGACWRSPNPSSIKGKGLLRGRSMFPSPLAGEEPGERGKSPANPSIQPVVFLRRPLGLVGAIPLPLDLEPSADRLLDIPPTHAPPASTQAS